MDTIEIFKLFGSIFVDNKEANKSISKTGKEADGLGKKLGNGIKTAGKWALGLTAAATGVATAAFAATDKVTQSFDKINKHSTKLGVSTDAYQEMSYWADQNGVAASDMERAIGRLNQRIGMAKNGNEKYSDALTNLGVNMKEVEAGTLSTEDALAQAIKGLSEMSSEQEKSAMAAELFGTKLARELMPALQDGSMSLEEAAEEARKLGKVIDEDTLNAGTAFQDNMTRMKAMLGGLTQNILSNLIPVFNSFLDWVINNMPMIQSIFQTVFDVLNTVFSKVADWIGKLISWLSEWFSSNQETVNGIWQTIQEVFTNVLAFLQETWEFIRNFWEEHGQAILDNVITVFSTIWETIETVFNTVKEIIEQVIGYVVPWVQEKLDVLREFWEENGAQIMEAVQNVFAFIRGVIEFVMPIIQGIIKGAWDIIRSIFDTVIGIIMGLVKTFSSLLTGDFEGIKEGLTRIWESLWNGIKGVVEGAWNLVKGAFNGLWDNIGDWFTGLVDDALRWGKDLITGFWEGIKSMGTWIADKVGGFIKDKIPGPIKSVLGIKSPSRLMMEYGENTGEGLVVGMGRSEKRVEQAAKNMAETVGDPFTNATNGESSSTHEQNNLSILEQLLIKLIEAVKEKQYLQVGQRIFAEVVGDSMEQEGPKRISLEERGLAIQ